MPTVTRTRRKLEEARFFLERLHENYGKLKKFDYYLSAFISSARSILWVMRSEYSAIAGWEEWYKQQLPSSEEAALLEGTNAIRIRTEKVEPLRSDSKFVVKGIRVPKEEVERFRTLMDKARDEKLVVKLSGDLSALNVEIAGETLSYPVTEVQIDRRLPEFPESDILDICKKYYAAVARVVTACEQRFKLVP